MAKSRRIKIARDQVPEVNGNYFVDFEAKKTKIFKATQSFYMAIKHRLELYLYKVLRTISTSNHSLSNMCTIKTRCLLKHVNGEHVQTSHTTQPTTVATVVYAFGAQSVTM